MQLNSENPRHRKIGMKRLLKLADFLKTVPKKRFNFGVFSDGVLGPGCGSKGCALGWATQIKGFRDRRRCGLELHIDDTWGEGEVRMYNIDGDLVTVGFGAGAAAFALDYDESYRLFSPGKSVNGECFLSVNATPKAVAKNIRVFVKKVCKEEGIQL